LIGIAKGLATAKLARFGLGREEKGRYGKGRYGKVWYGLERKRKGLIRIEWKKIA